MPPPESRPTGGRRRSGCPARVRVEPLERSPVLLQKLLGNPDDCRRSRASRVCEDLPTKTTTGRLCCLSPVARITYSLPASNGPTPSITKSNTVTEVKEYPGYATYCPPERAGNRSPTTPWPGPSSTRGNGRIQTRITATGALCQASPPRGGRRGIHSSKPLKLSIIYATADPIEERVPKADPLLVGLRRKPTSYRDWLRRKRVSRLQGGG